MAAEAPKRMMGNGVSEEASVVHVRNWRHSVAEDVSPKNLQNLHNTLRTPLETEVLKMYILKVTKVP